MKGNALRWEPRRRWGAIANRAGFPMMVGLIRKNPNRTSAFAKPAYRTGRATADGTGLRLILLPPTAAAQTLSRRRFGKTAKEPVKTIGSNFLVYPEFIEGCANRKL